MCSKDADIHLGGEAYGEYSELSQRASHLVIIDHRSPRSHLVKNLFFTVIKEALAMP